MITLREFQNATLNIGRSKMSEKRLIITNDFKLYCGDGFFIADLILKVGQSVLINLLNNYEIKK